MTRAHPNAENAPERRSIGIIGAWHFSFTVSDLDAAIRFYCDLLDFVLVRRSRNSSEYVRRLVGYPDADLDIAQLAVPGHRTGLADHDLELVAYLTPPGRAISKEIRDPGASHLALAVADANATYERLRAAGVSFVSEPNEITTGANKGGKGFYFRGPDAIMHELVQPPWVRDGAPPGA